VLRFHPLIAPVTAAVFPLVKKEGMPERARAIVQQLREAGVAPPTTRRARSAGATPAGRGRHAVVRDVDGER